MGGCCRTKSLTTVPASLRRFAYNLTSGLSSFDDSLFQDDIGIECHFTGRQNGIGFLCALIKSKAFYEIEVSKSRFMSLNSIAIVLPDDRLVGVARDDRHECNRLVDILIKGKDTEYGIEQHQTAQSIGADQALGKTRRREISICDDELIAVTHLHQNLDEVR